MAAENFPQDDVGAVSNCWPHRLAVLTTAATFLLILAGGVVTNTGTGMAVPDWPTTFGYNMFLYPWSKMVGGVLYEHTHRLLASLVGSLTLTLAVLLWAVEPRRYVLGLGIAALAAVVIQGVLGGLRVVLAENALAIVHGAFAHAFFAMLAAIARRGRHGHSCHGRSIRLTSDNANRLNKATPVSPASCKSIGVNSTRNAAAAAEMTAIVRLRPGRALSGRPPV